MFSEYSRVASPCFLAPELQETSLLLSSVALLLTCETLEHKKNGFLLALRTLCWNLFRLASALTLLTDFNSIMNNWTAVILQKGWSLPQGRREKRKHFKLHYSLISTKIKLLNKCWSHCGYFVAQYYPVLPADEFRQATALATSCVFFWQPSFPPLLPALISLVNVSRQLYWLMVVYSIAPLSQCTNTWSGNSNLVTKNPGLKYHTAGKAIIYYVGVTRLQGHRR